MTDVDILEHFGVKGMKWGVRRKRTSSRTKTTFKTPPKKLSDSDLKKRIQRLEAEKRYNDLNRQDISAGKAVAADILVGSGKQIAKSVVLGVGTVLVKQALESKFGPEVAKAVK